MQITTEKMRKAGSLLGNSNLTDDELLMSLEAVNLALAFIEGAGLKWSLARTPLIYELDCLKGFAIARGLIKCPSSFGR